MKKEFCIIVTTCDSKEIADKIINSLLDKRLVSCIHTSNVNSSYIWNEKIESNNEILLQMKSKKELYKEVEEEILKVHGYKIPEILMYSIDNGYEQYMNGWTMN